MSYSIVPDDIINVDMLINQIKVYVHKFNEYERQFVKCKNEENFERNLEAKVPELSYKIAGIYSSGRTLAFSVVDYINEYLTIEQTPLLKTAVDKLEPELAHLKEWGEAEHSRISEIYKKSECDEWSVNTMLSDTFEMCDQLSEILTLINVIKASYSYQLQSGEITMREISNLKRANMSTINNSGNFQMSTGDGNTMTINQSYNQELTKICQKLIDAIDQSPASPTEKDAAKTLVYEIKEPNNLSSLKGNYYKLTSLMSDHITIGSAILGSGVLSELTKIAMC